MTRNEVDRINRERVSRWERHLREHFATAVVVIGTPHDDTSNPPVIVTVDETDLPKEELVAYLRWAADEIERGS